MIHLLDNDIVQKLAIFDLLDHALVARGATRSDAYLLPTLKYRIGGKARGKAENRLGKDVVDRIHAFLKDAREIQVCSNDDALVLEDVMGIDQGEVVILSATASLVDYRILTGDKRCLRTVATHPQCKGIAGRIRGQVICLEQVVCRMIVHFGFEHIRDKLVPYLDCDAALRAAFGSGKESTESNSVACLQEYIAELRGLPVDLLVVED